MIVSLLARMRSIPGVLVSGIGVGVIETIVKGNVATTNQTIVDVFMLIAVLVVVLWLAVSAQRADGHFAEGKPPDRLRTVFWVRNLNRIGFAALFGALAVLPVFATTSAGLFTWSVILIWAMVALSMTVLLVGPVSCRSVSLRSWASVA